ncbi:flavodoxin [Alkaliphilus metalliredigens QYMF]|uniref:Flavodoxin n=1 Tax=Alkaliphilus metalliredigens (strain QYMF) TaxID=293826 RepID=A6TUE7_ALKMQ|nr:flavodoxin [Alkaliphilus metalliredigens]ABR49815.1 flavodoxin [Alkaliphilus metalliredigens QYMF]
MEVKMKKLVVYYSLEGNTQLIAEAMAKAIGADILVLNPQNEMKSKGFSKYLWGGTQVMMKKLPLLQPLIHDATAYDLILIGTPVWAWTYAPPLGTFFSQVDLKDKQIGLFSCHGGQNGKTFEKMRQILDKNIFLGEIDFFEPLKNQKPEQVEKASKWAREIEVKASY